KENPRCALVLTGCFPQAFKKEAEKIHEADIITGASNKNEIPALVDEFFKNKMRIIRIPDHSRQEKFESMKNEKYPDKTRAYVKIQDGCNQYCSYCIIPYARGFVRSKPLDELVFEVELLSSSGHEEIVLVGINLSCYGIDIESSLIEAIEAVCKIDGIKRVRLGSLEPELISDDDIKRMAAQKKLCPQFHLSLQSGCDRTLREMNRKYTSAEYFELIRKLKAAFDNCSITTDVMVGFPGENDDDFKASLEFVKKCDFSKVHVFPYSPREGTAAAKRTDQLDARIKENRAHKMNEIAEASQKKFLESQIGKAVEVLFERSISDGFFKGYSSNYTLVKINAEKCGIDLRKKIFCVKILKCKNDCCIGEVML
ncbi:MAG: MiaB/RimO family radical SAM methylthiotransferase, partial [Oscillospiraceae bacterium]